MTFGVIPPQCTSVRAQKETLQAPPAQPRRTHTRHAGLSAQPRGPRLAPATPARLQRACAEPRRARPAHTAPGAGETADARASHSSDSCPSAGHPSSAGLAAFRLPPPQYPIAEQGRGEEPRLAFGRQPPGVGGAGPRTWDFGPARPGRQGTEEP